MAKVLVSSVAMGVVLYVLRPYSADFFSRFGLRIGSVLSLGTLVFCGMAVYGVFSLVLMPDALRNLRRFRARR